MEQLLVKQDLIPESLVKGFITLRRQTWTALSDQVFCISDTTSGIFVRRGRSAKVSTLYNPIDIAAFAEAQRRVSHTKKCADIRHGYV